MNRKPAVDGPPVGSVNSLDWNEVMVDRNWTKRVTQAAASTARDRLLGTADRGATLAKGVESIEAARLEQERLEERQRLQIADQRG